MYMSAKFKKKLQTDEYEKNIVEFKKNTQFLHSMHHLTIEARSPIWSEIYSGKFLDNYNIGTIVQTASFLKISMQWVDEYIINVVVYYVNNDRSIGSVRKTAAAGQRIREYGTYMMEFKCISRYNENDCFTYISSMKKVEFLTHQQRGMKSKNSFTVAANTLNKHKMYGHY